MPSPVDKYFKQIKQDNPSYSDEQAWATAWSIHCKYKDPGSPSCHKPTEEYFKKKAAAAPVLDFYRTLLAAKLDPDDVKRRLSAYTEVVVDAAIELDSHTRNPLDFYSKCSEILAALGDVFDHVDDEGLAEVLREASKKILSGSEGFQNQNYWKKLPPKEAHLAFKYQPKETKQHKVERVGERIRETTGLPKGTSYAIADAFVRGRDVSALSIQKDWPIEQGVVTGPRGNIQVSELTSLL